MYREPKPMREIHEIQEELSKEEKGLSSEERIKKIHREAQEFIKKYHIKFKNLPM